MSILIDNIKLAHNVILAPMSGVTDKPFRKLVKRYGGGLVVSEMIASRAMILETKDALKKAANDVEEYPMSVQLAGCEPEVMAEAAKLNEDRGAAIIDINFGCPVKKVVNGYAGSALMKDECLAAKILEATVKAVKLPVTLKMRTGWDQNNRNAPKLAKIAEELGIKMITIHGRTRAQMYNGKADWEFISEIKERVKIPVIANGDIVSFDGAKRALLESKADGIMIGRGAYGKPWFIKQTASYLETGNILSEPNFQEKTEVILEHYEDILSHYGTDAGVKIARKHLGWYSSGIPRSAEFRSSVNKLGCHKLVKESIRSFFK